MTEFVTSATIHQYRGELYRMLFVGDDYAAVVIDAATPHDRFPDAVEFGVAHGESWVKLPLASLEATFDRTVFGRWNGVPVLVSRLFTDGPAQGLVKVVYVKGSAAEAAAAGIPGNEYDGWRKNVDPAEVEIVDVKVVERTGLRFA